MTGVNMGRAWMAAAMAALALAGCGPAKGPAAVDAARLTKADKDPGDWMSQGRTYSEQRFSPLEQINAGNVKDLGLAWNFELNDWVRMETFEAG